jgi:hypothetical protein
MTPILALLHDLRNPRVMHGSFLLYSTLALLRNLLTSDGATA